MPCRSKNTCPGNGRSNAMAWRACASRACRITGPGRATRAINPTDESRFIRWDWTAEVQSPRISLQPNHCINTKERLGRGSLTDRGSISLIRISIAMALHGAFFKGGKYVPAIFSHHQEQSAASLKSSLPPLASFLHVTPRFKASYRVGV